MVAEEVGVGALPGPGVLAGQHQEREGRRGDCGASGRTAAQSQQRRDSEDEPAEVREGGGHGGTLLSERGQCPAQPHLPLLLWSHLCEYSACDVFLNF